MEGQPAAAVVAHPGASKLPVLLAEPGSEERWRQLQRLRRGGDGPLQPWIDALAGGALPVTTDLLAALWARLDRDALTRLLGSVAAAEAGPWLMAGQLELPSLTSQPNAIAVWLEPLLQLQATACADQALLWLQLLGQFRDPRVADLLRQVLAPLAAASSPPTTEALRPLLPLLGLQRQPRDLDLLLALAKQPGPLALRHAALEGVALGLTSWSPQPLAAALEALVTDLNPDLAASALDLLARLPQGGRSLRRLLGRRLDPSVRARLRRRLRPTPLVLLVHGRQGGALPAELQTLASELSDRRGAPVMLQALSAKPPVPDAVFWAAARRAGGLSLVPLLLLPGDHVCRDLPALAAAWRIQAAGAAVRLRRLHFLGAWPTWQRALAETLRCAAADADTAPCWLHHRLKGPLAARFLAHLTTVLGCPGEATSYTAAAADLACCSGGHALLLPLTLAANRLSESLTRGTEPPVQVLPPLLEIPALRQALLANLENLP